MLILQFWASTCNSTALQFIGGDMSRTLRNKFTYINGTLVLYILIFMYSKRLTESNNNNESFALQHYHIFLCIIFAVIICSQL